MEEGGGSSGSDENVVFFRGTRGVLGSKGMISRMVMTFKLKVYAC